MKTSFTHISDHRRTISASRANGASRVVSNCGFVLIGATFHASGSIHVKTGFAGIAYSGIAVGSSRAIAA
jgi:hypothetical protein